VLFVFLFVFAVYTLASFTLRESEKINRKRTLFDVLTAFTKVFIISFISFSFFIYSMSFLLRIENRAFTEQDLREVVTTEEVLLLAEESIVSKEEVSRPPLFDSVIQAATEQNQGNQLTFVLTAGGVLGLIVVLIMMMYITHRIREKERGNNHQDSFP